ncbi:hypothetical protein HPB52_004664 [Rhipicephalus sanguineus]|uniref:Protein nlrc3 n=1 Tax=Rhipicephalus sanguineus TaxID=34632 RepID=A0A9D4T708_RHISA|nr:hypothetical protein HPB52_004664 [Rhipicephalus sanguineus]
MDDVAAEHVDTQNADVQELYRKGFERYQELERYKSQRRANETSAITQYGPILVYGHISEKDAAVLHRMLRSGKPVKRLCLHDISLGAFKVSFDDLEESPSLRYLYFHIDLKGEKLGTSFSGVFRSLYSLEISCDNAGSGFANEIASCIQQNKSLRELRLSKSCGSDEGAAILIEALVSNDTLKIFALHYIKSSWGTLIGFAKMLATNRTLEMVRLGEVCCGEVDEVWSLLAQERYASVFQRLEIEWPDELLSVLTVLIRREACSSTLSVRITSSVDERVLREFFQAVATNKTLRELNFESDAFDALANGIASVVKSTGTLREIFSATEVKRGNEHKLITILNALKENSSITHFTMWAETVTPQAATSIAELLAANKALRDLHLCGESRISPSAGEIILQGLWVNYTLTELTVCSELDANDITRDIEAILNRNYRILRKAVDFVISGGDVNDQFGPYALKKVHSSAGFVEMLKSRTKKTTDATLEDIQAVLARMTV